MLHHRAACLRAHVLPAQPAPAPALFGQGCRGRPSLHRSVQLAPAGDARRRHVARLPAGDPHLCRLRRRDLGPLRRAPADGTLLRCCRLLGRGHPLRHQKRKDLLSRAAAARRGVRQDRLRVLLRAGASCRAPGPLGPLRKGPPARRQQRLPAGLCAAHAPCGQRALDVGARGRAAERPLRRVQRHVLRAAAHGAVRRLPDFLDGARARPRAAPLPPARAPAAPCPCPRRRR